MGTQERSIHFEYSSTGSEIWDVSEFGEQLNIHEKMDSIRDFCVGVRQEVANYVRNELANNKENLELTSRALLKHFLGKEFSAKNMLLQINGLRIYDGFGNYTKHPVLYASLIIDSEKFFLKISPNDYHSGGVAEALENTYVNSRIEQEEADKIKVIPFVAATESQKDNCAIYLSKWPENFDHLVVLDNYLDNLKSLARVDKEAENKYHELVELFRVSQKFQGFDNETYNAFYDPDEDKILLFDLNPPTSINHTSYVN